MRTPHSSLRRTTIRAALPAPDNGGPFTDVVAPIVIDDRYRGAVVARVSLPELLRRSVAPDVALRYRVSLLADSGDPLASTTASATPEDALVYEVPIYLLPDGVMLQASAFRVRAPLMSHALAWVVAGLTIAVLVTLIALMRRDARQARVERALRAETAFRRAMEDSLATGLAVIDRLGVIRHVNAAFCQMTGWPVTELVGLQRTVAVLAAGPARPASGGAEGPAGRQGAREWIRAQGAAPRRIAVRRAAVRLPAALR